MPSSVSTFGPLEPSPGNGPAVSSGIGVELEPPLDPDDPVPGLWVEPVVVVVFRNALLLEDAQPTNATTPTPPRSFRRSRLSMPATVGRVPEKRRRFRDLAATS
jgi:hypothetical protein